MIAEIYHKISADNSNLNARCEDELTGNFFGNMRYLPYKRGLKIIFDAYAVSPYDKEFRSVLVNIMDEEFEFEFWKRSSLGYGEIDGLIFVGGVAIGIEVKLYSDLSGENQLKREAKMLREWYGNATPKLLLFIAPENSVKDVYINNYQELAQEKVHLGYITWENVLKGLKLIDVKNRYEKIIVQDLINLLKEKGFDSFESFEINTEVKDVEYYEFW